MTECKTHKQYQAIRKPRVNCKECWDMYFEKHDIKKAVPLVQSHDEAFRGVIKLDGHGDKEFLLSTDEDGIFRAIDTEEGVEYVLVYG